MTRKPFLSVVIPVFNESKRIHNLIEISNYIKSKKFLSEIIVVNDGSKDDTLKKINQLKNIHNLKIVSYVKNMGKGYAIKKGISEAAGKCILFCDVDLSTPIQELDHFLPFINSYDIVMATRRIKDSKLIARQSTLREILGRAFTFLSQIILNLQISDFTCGFKLFSQNAANEIFPLLTIDRWGFDSELLFVAKKKGFRIREVGVKWQNNPLTKVKFPNDIFISLSELIKIRINNFRAAYE